MASASFRRSVFFPLSTSTNSFTSDQLPPFRYSATALRCASMPRPDLPCRSVETRRYEIHFPSAISILQISQPSLIDLYQHSLGLARPIVETPTSLALSCPWRQRTGSVIKVLRSNIDELTVPRFRWL